MYYKVTYYTYFIHIKLLFRHNYESRLMKKILLKKVVADLRRFKKKTKVRGIGHFVVIKCQASRPARRLMWPTPGARSRCPAGPAAAEDENNMVLYTTVYMTLSIAAHYANAPGLDSFR